VEKNKNARLKKYKKYAGYQLFKIKNSEISN